ncbi:MAG TPA: Hpt domain-containing protein, partial [Chthoniobacteraceae bacterium]
LIDVFLENTPKVLAEGRAALAAHSTPQLARVAHMLKGSCSNFGAERMRQACARLEDLANTGVEENSDQLLSEVEKEFACVRIALERERPACVAA